MATADDESMDITDDVLSEELVALEAIYIKELTVEYDEKNRPQSIAVMLHPATGMDESKQYVCMTLCFNFPPDYPDVLPDIMVKNPRGLGEENLQSLIEDMLKKAEERKGGQMLYELIEMAKDCLTEGNLPHCECAICLDHFEEGDNFFKTDCYHYYHRVCLGRCFSAHMASLQQEEQEGAAVLHRSSNNGEQQNVFRCPMCRVPLNYDLDDLLTEIPVEEKEEVVALPQEVIEQQQERAALYERQKAKGGIIDLEQEKNKFFVDENTVLRVSKSEDSTNQPPSEKQQPEPDNQQESEPPASSRKGKGTKPSHRPPKYSHAGGRSRKNHHLDYTDISQGYSDYEDGDYDDDDTQVVEADRYHRSGGRGVRSDRGGARGGGGRGIRGDYGGWRGSGRRGRNDVGSERGRGRNDFGSERGRGRKPREAPLSADQESRTNQSWRSDSDYINSGEGYSEHVPFSAQSIDGVRNDRTAARNGNSNYRGGHRGQGGRDHNRTNRRGERDELRDCSDANFRRDRGNRKPDFMGSAENLREREKYNREKRESSRNRETERGEEHSGCEKENEGGGGTEGVKNFRDGDRDRRMRDGYTKTDNQKESWHDRTSPRDRSDRGHPRKDDTRGQHSENTRNRQERNNGAYQGRRGGRHQPQEDTERGGGYKEPRPRASHREKGDRDSPRDLEKSEREGGYKEPRPRAHHREKGDRDSPRDLEKPGPTHSPRDKEGHSRHQDFRDFPDNRYRNQRSGDSRHHTHQRKNENYQGSGKEHTEGENSEDGYEGGGYKNRRHIADRQNSHETDDSSEAAQEDRWSKPRVRGDRTFVRGQGNRGRSGGRGQNRTAGTQWDTAQGRGRQRKTEERGHNHFARAGRRPEHAGQNAEEDWGSDKRETEDWGRDKQETKDWGRDKQETVPSTAEPSSRKTGQSVKEDGKSDSHERTSNKDGESAHQHRKPQANKGQRSGPKDRSGGDQSHKYRDGATDGDSGQSHTPSQGFSDPRPPPGFTRENNPWGANPPRAPAKVGPPPGFS